MIQALIQGLIRRLILIYESLVFQAGTGENVSLY